MTDDEHRELTSRQPAMVLFADGYVGLEITRFLLARYRDDLVGVVSTSENEIHRMVSEHGVKSLQYDKNGSFLERLPPKIDLGILAWWPSIIKEPLLSLPSRGFLNTHPSLLPHNRGKHPNFWSIVEMRPFGVSLHKIDAGVDTGPIVAQRQIHYDWTDTGGTLYKRALQATVDLFRETYPKIRDGSQLESKQGSNGSCHLAKELDPASEIHLDREYTARVLLNLLRARTFDQYPACYFTDEDETYEVRVEITRKPKNE